MTGKEAGIVKKFLKDRNCLKEFEKYLWQHRCKTFDEFAQSISINQMISDAFGWSDTTQGFYYWCDLSDNLGHELERGTL